MSIISRLMRYYGCEVLITFMYEEINRFLTADYRTKEYQYDALFMKDAMWAVDPSGTYQFSDFTDRQLLLLFQPEPDYSLLKCMLLAHFLMVKMSASRKSIVICWKRLPSVWLGIRKSFMTAQPDLPQQISEQLARLLRTIDPDAQVHVKRTSQGWLHLELNGI